MAQTDTGLIIPDRLHKQAKHEGKMVGNPITPDGLATAMNREIRRRIDKELRRKAKEPVAPVIVPKPLNDIRTALDKVVDILMTSPGGMYRSTIVTLAKELDVTEGRKLIDAYDKQLPLPRQSIRTALESIRTRADRQRAALKSRRAS